VKSHANARFWESYRQLPQRAQRSARRAYLRFAADPFHPGLQFKQVHPSLPIFSARVGLGYRALAVRDGDSVIWFWVGSHADYDRLIANL